MVELRIALDDRTWRVGAPVRVEIAPRTLKAVVTVPRDAVILRQARATSCAYGPTTRQSAWR
jgi:hypothetical protein